MDYTTLLFLDCRTTLWEKPSEQPAGQHTEITRIDIAVVDTQKNQITDQEIIYVKPKKSKINSYAEKVFKVKQSILDSQGVSFQEAYRRLRIHYMSRDRLWAGWGLYDKYSLDKQCKLLDLESLFAHPHHNVQHMFSVMTGVTESDPTLAEALKYCEASSSDNEAVDTAQIYMRMARGLRPAVVKTRLVVPGQCRPNMN